MARDRNKSPASEERERDNKSKGKAQDSDPSSESDHGSKKRSREITNSRERKRTKHSKGSESVSESEYSSESEGERRRRKRKERKRTKNSKGSESESESEYSSESEGERRRRRKRRERKRREEREKKRRRREKEKKKKEKEKKKREKGKKGAVTSSWGKFGIIRETDMWNKRPEFTAWLAEVKQLNLESLPNWEEKQLFKDFMEDHNTATFPSKKYYNLDAYYKHKLEKETKKGMKNIGQTEMTIFNDEEIRRQEMQQVRDRQKAEEVEALKRSMQGGMAQAMKEQALLREEMLYQYKIGNLEAAAAIQRRLDPDVAM